MNELTTIEITSLDTINGGNGSNETGGRGRLSVRTGVGVQVEGEGEYRQTRTDYAHCLDTFRAAGASVEQMVQACGRPGGSQPPPATGNP
jgi:hypothetical protein